MPCISGRNQFENTKFNRPKMLKSIWKEGREKGREIEEGEEIWQSRVVSFPHLASLSLSLPPKYSTISSKHDLPPWHTYCLLRLPRPRRLMDLMRKTTLDQPLTGLPAWLNDCTHRGKISPLTRCTYKMLPVRHAKGDNQRSSKFCSNHW